MIQTQNQQLVEKEMKELTAEYQNDKLEFIRNPVVAKFLGLAPNTNFTESDLKKDFDQFAEVFDGAWKRQCFFCRKKRKRPKIKGK